MPLTFRNSFYVGLLAAFVISIWLVRLWGAEKQVRLHSEHLVHQVERRSWSAVENSVARDYRDEWGDDRARLLARLRLAGRFCFDLTITASETQTQVNPPLGTWRARIRLDGRGEGAGEITSRVNSLTTPFVLDWRRESWKPWDWKLVRVTNESLEIPEGEF